MLFDFWISPLSLQVNFQKKKNNKKIIYLVYLEGIQHSSTTSISTSTSTTDACLYRVLFLLFFHARSFALFFTRLFATFFFTLRRQNEGEKNIFLKSYRKLATNKRDKKNFAEELFNKL